MMDRVDAMRRNAPERDGRRSITAVIYDKLGEWCPGAELNHRHCDFQSHALPTELPGRSAIGIYRKAERAPL